MAAMTTVLAWGILDYKDAFVAQNEWDNALATLRWSYDYFIKAHPSANEFYGQVGDGNADHAYWGRPEEWVGERPAFKITTSAPGSDLAGETSAALAAGYLIFRDSDSSYANNLLQHSKQLYDFANQYRGKYSDSISAAANFYK